MFQSGCGDGSLLIWDFELNTLPLPPKKVSGHSAWVYAAAFSPNGNVLTSIDHTGNIFIWCTKVTAFNLNDFLKILIKFDEAELGDFL